MSIFDLGKGVYVFYKKGLRPGLRFFADVAVGGAASALIYEGTKKVVKEIYDNYNEKKR